MAPLPGRHHRQLARLHHDAARLIDDDVVLVEPALPDPNAGGDDPQPPIGGQGAQDGGQLDGGRPTGASDGKGDRDRQIAAHEGEQCVRGDATWPGPHLKGRRPSAPPARRGLQRRRQGPHIAAGTQVGQTGQRMTGADRCGIVWRFGAIISSTGLADSSGVAGPDS